MHLPLTPSPLHCAPPHPQKDLSEAGCSCAGPDQPGSSRAVGFLETPSLGEGLPWDPVTGQGQCPGASGMGELPLCIHLGAAVWGARVLWTGWTREYTPVTGHFPSCPSQFQSRSCPVVVHTSGHCLSGQHDRAEVGVSRRGSTSPHSSTLSPGLPGPRCDAAAQAEAGGRLGVLGRPRGPAGPGHGGEATPPWVPSEGFLGAGRGAW